MIEIHGRIVLGLGARVLNQLLEVDRSGGQSQRELEGDQQTQEGIQTEEGDSEDLPTFAYSAKGSADGSVQMLALS
jgi:hypothetical protein